MKYRTRFRTEVFAITADVKPRGSLNRDEPAAFFGKWIAETFKQKAVFPLKGRQVILNHHVTAVTAAIRKRVDS